MGFVWYPLGPKGYPLGGFGFAKPMPGSLGLGNGQFSRAGHRPPFIQPIHCSPLYPNGTSITGDPTAAANGCKIGKYPPYVVNATEISHVQAALEFAKAKNLRLNIKNTGHGADRSTAYGSLSIWTHHMKHIQFHHDFHSQSCSGRSSQHQHHLAATLGAGVQVGELFRAMAKHNAIAVGGCNDDVGVVGWATGGGHGLASAVYGMGADNILAATIVTAAGEIVTADACQHEDLFWAIRGGGGGTFGVIVSLTVKAFPMPSVGRALMATSPKGNASVHDWWRFVAELHVQFAQLQNAGISGYYTLYTNPRLFQVSLFEYNGTRESLVRALGPLASFTHRWQAFVTVELITDYFPAWYDMVRALPVNEYVGTRQYRNISRLIPRAALDDLDLFAAVLEEISTPTPHLGVSSPIILGTMSASKQPVDNALNPAWRDSIVHLIVSRSWDDSLPRDIAEQVTRNMTFVTGDALRRLAPASGAYFNEADPDEPQWQSSFFGSNYARLLQTKQDYDPEGVFWCHQCVGSEIWAELQNGSLCRSF
ncbi:hypothetical protein CNMCM5793_003544 [Aspergillus hiratsukae]|uniref:FAD-binding PCMH-type domain-containing protein n=1 Tax=Aspergillus hiratsukae TaxID=1194566 RepID=A0A8H6PEG2_9EURO|nr:hypothetical protein CNMCM5793_003544 [Aspergillus hiratsukae]KAF7168560.1 hypothetical protein CNMCM6106_003698 [Aspergillus hiratsukae]